MVILMMMIVEMKKICEYLSELINDEEEPKNDTIGELIVGLEYIKENKTDISNEAKGIINQVILNLKRGLILYKLYSTDHSLEAEENRNKYLYNKESKDKLHVRDVLRMNSRLKEFIKDMNITRIGYFH